MEKVYIACDIGKSGGFCALSSSGEILEMIPMPKIGKEVDYTAVCTFLNKYKDQNPHMVFEKLQAIFKVAKSAAFSLGFQAGAIEMACIALQIPFTKCPPKQWQAQMFTGIAELKRADGKRDTKNMALIIAQRLYPGVSFKKNGRCTIDHDGMIDALLLCVYAQRNNL